MLAEQLLQGFTREYLAALFSYSVVTGEITRRVKRQYQPAGKVVGSVDGKGYLHVNLDGRFIRLHRLAWFLVTGTVPVKGVDHWNNAKTANYWLNLREASQHENSGNTGIPVNNTSGYKGVSLNSRSQLWHVQIKKHGKQTYVGRYENKHAAALIYNWAAETHFSTFAKLNDVAGFGRVSIPPTAIDLFT